MKKQFDLIVFDWDGTLMDSAGAIVTSLQNASLDAGLPAPSDDEARHVIGLGLMEAMRHLFPESTDEDCTRLSDFYRIHYLKACEKGISLFEGAEDTVHALKNDGYFLAVATGKGRRGLDSALTSSGIGHHFHASRCADECHSKPHPAMLLELMEEFGVSPDKTLMIGDTTHDLLMAQNAGVRSLALAHGAHPRKSLEALAPLGCFEDFKELGTWLEENA